jgi:CBS domain-containing protein
MTSSHANSQPPETGPGLEPAVTVAADRPASQVLEALRATGVKAAVVVDANGRPQSVLPERTLAKAPGSQPVALCKPAWSAAIFHEPTTPEERQRNAELWLSGGYEPPPHGSRTVVMRGTQIIGLIPVPGLFNRPGPASRVLERVLTPVVSLVLKQRH